MEKLYLNLPATKETKETKMQWDEEHKKWFIEIDKNEKNENYKRMYLKLTPNNRIFKYDTKKKLWYLHKKDYDEDILKQISFNIELFTQKE